MNLIPVIDLMRGQVVRAVRGDRRAYQPIASQLCAGSDPLVLARVLCDHCATHTLYVADLDALMGAAVQTGVLRALLRELPQLTLWLDAGLTGADSAIALRSALGSDAGRVVPVFGSESIASRAALEACFASAAAKRDSVLSLDRRDGRKLDAAGCWESPALWPERVIVMTLERVGANAGPDLETLAEVQRAAPNKFIVGAGGIRDAADLARAEAAGAGAWLVASALHDGRLPRVLRDAALSALHDAAPSAWPDAAPSAARDPLPNPAGRGR